MSDIVNLRRVRKAKVRAAVCPQANANRVKHGVSKPTRDLAKAQAEKLHRDLRARKLDEK